MLNDIADSPAVLDDVIERLARLLQIGRHGAQHAQGSMGVGNKRADGLVDLVRNRGRQLADGRDAADVGELGVGVAQVFRGQGLLGEIAGDGERAVHLLRVEPQR